MNYFDQLNAVSSLNGECFVWKNKQFYYHGDINKCSYEEIADEMAWVSITDEKYLKLLGVNYKVEGNKAIILGNYEEETVTLPAYVLREDLKRYVPCKQKTHTAPIVKRSIVVWSSCETQRNCILNIKLLKAAEKLGEDAGRIFNDNILSGNHCPGEKEINGKRHFLFRFGNGFVLFNCDNFKDGVGNLIVPQNIPVGLIVGKDGRNVKRWAEAMGVKYIHVVKDV